MVCLQHSRKTQKHFKWIIRAVTSIEERLSQKKEFGSSISTFHYEWHLILRPNILIDPIHHNIYFCSPWKRQKTRCSLTFSGVYKWVIGVKCVRFIRKLILFFPRTILRYIFCYWKLFVDKKSFKICIICRTRKLGVTKPEVNFSENKL